jgi:4-hydroxy 2-oxovalerate aldolase
LKDKIVDNIKLPIFNQDQCQEFKIALIIGGGPSSILHFEAIKIFIEKHQKEICIIHASTKNAWIYRDIDVPQFFCLVGNEGYRMEKVFSNLNIHDSMCVLPAYPRKMGTYIPDKMKSKAYELKSVTFVDQFRDSHTALALQTAIDVNSQVTYVAGYDGYFKEIKEKEKGLIEENEYLFQNYNNKFERLISLTSTNYKNISVESIFSYI